MSVTEAELKEFEQQADHWFAENKPATPDFILPETFMEVGTDQQFEYLRDWQNKVYEAGFMWVWRGLKNTVVAGWTKPFRILPRTECQRI